MAYQDGTRRGFSIVGASTRRTLAMRTEMWCIVALPSYRYGGTLSLPIDIHIEPFAKRYADNVLMAAFEIPPNWTVGGVSDKTR
jgi:hypothetical protein